MGIWTWLTIHCLALGSEQPNPAERLPATFPLDLILGSGFNTHPLGPWNHLEGVAFSQSSSEEAEADLGAFWTGSRSCGVSSLCFGVKRWHLTPHPEDGDVWVWSSLEREDDFCSRS